MSLDDTCSVCHGWEAIQNKCLQELNWSVNYDWINRDRAFGSHFLYSNLNKDDKIDHKLELLSQSKFLRNLFFCGQKTENKKHQKKNLDLRPAYRESSYKKVRRYGMKTVCSVLIAFADHNCALGNEQQDNTVEMVWRIDWQSDSKYVIMC